MAHVKQNAIMNKHYCVLSNSGLSNATWKVRNGQNWHSSVGKNVHHNHETAKIGFCTSLKSISGFVDTRDKVNAD